MSHIVPLLWFDRNAEEAVRYYVSIFGDARINRIARFGDAVPEREGEAMIIDFTLEGQPFLALNGGTPTGRDFAVALYLECPTQAEVDRVWERLTDGGETLPCGWLRDRYGFAWNVVPAGFRELVSDAGDPASQNAMRAMFEMEKLDLERVRAAYRP